MRTHLSLLLLAALLAACAGAPPVATAPASGVDEGAPLAMFQPQPNLFTAGQPQVWQWRQAKAAGVATVINLRPREEMDGRDEAAEVTAAGMRYVALPVAGRDDLDFENAMKLHVLLRGADGPVLLHCASGNRAGALLALSLAQAGMPAEQALQVGRDGGMRSTEARVREVLGLPPPQE